MRDRFTVTYAIDSHSTQDATDRAKGICLEQTVEIPADIVPSGYIADTIVGQIESLEQKQDGLYMATMSYSPDSVGGQLPQLLNVIFGNSSIQKGIKVQGFDLGTSLSHHFSGAKFGISGVRKLVNRPQGALISPVLKPQGLSADELAKIAYQCVLGGADIIKEDHGLANQTTAPFMERVEKISHAVQQANAETGQNSLYFPNIAGNVTDIIPYATHAKQVGATGLLILPGLYGFDSVWQLTQFGLPLMTHPSFLGPYVLCDDTGFTHGAMFGALQRLSGADISVFPNMGGRFGFSKDECMDIANTCRSSQGVGNPIFPGPGGGMTFDRASDIMQMYGQDSVLLLGGSLLQYQDKIADGVKQMRSALDSFLLGN